jgi:phage tail sheath protein FI
MSEVYKTPGVYIEEKDAFSTSIIPVPTAVPAFIGHTERAIKDSNSLLMKPTRITSFAEFEGMFGGAPVTTFELAEGEGEQAFKLQKPLNQFYLYRSMKLFYNNGGGDCWIVSVGSYTDAPDPTKFNEGLTSLLKVMEPTMLVSPDAMLLKDVDCYAFQENMINQGGDPGMRDRIAILDIHGGNLEDGTGGFKDIVEANDIADNGDLFSQINDANGDAVENIIDRFRNVVGLKNPDFAAAYYPWLHTATTTANEVSSANIADLTKLKAMIDSEADQQLDAEAISADRHAQIQAETQRLVDEAGIVDTERAAIETAADAAARKTSQDNMKAALKNVNSIEQTLMAVSPLFKDILKDIRAKLNVLPPSGAIAGLISYVDNSMGVARSPANVSLSSVTGPTINISNEEQETLNLPLNGKAVNAIRTFPGKGVLVWGARTLDGNSQDWRYISVRRAVIMIEQSIKIALGAFVFEPNNQNTWLDVGGSITNFLTAQWANGALIGGSNTRQRPLM